MRTPWYHVCACGAKWFCAEQDYACPRCHAPSQSRERIAPPWHGSRGEKPPANRLRLDAGESCHEPLMAPLKRLFQVVSGNTIGVVDEPEVIDPEKPLREQLIVKIGVLDPLRARREGFSADDARIVVDRLREFVTHMLKGED